MYLLLIIIVYIKRIGFSIAIHLGLIHNQVQGTHNLPGFVLITCSNLNSIIACKGGGRLKIVFLALLSIIDIKRYLTVFTGL